MTGCGILTLDSLLWIAGCGLLTEIPDCGFLAVEPWLGIPVCGLVAEDSWLWVPGSGLLRTLGSRLLAVDSWLPKVPKWRHQASQITGLGTKSDSSGWQRGAGGSGRSP